MARHDVRGVAEARKQLPDLLALKPELVVALGATAAKASFGPGLGHGGRRGLERCDRRAE
jgi:hypothetical protein